MTMKNCIDTKVAIGISIYKQPLKWVKKSVNSVINQTTHCWHLRIRCDGKDSIDTETREYLNKIAIDSRISVIYGSENVGTFGNYKILFDDIEADYIIQLDADDYLSVNALERSLADLSNSYEAPYLYSDCALVDQDGKRIGSDLRSCTQWTKDNELISFIPFHMRLVRYSAYKSILGYDKSFFFAGDYDLSLRLSELGDPIHLQEELYFYRVHNLSQSQLHRARTHSEAITASRSALSRRGLDKNNCLLSNCKDETTILFPSTKKVFLVVGMHRSGTSVIARYLSALGIQFGRELLKADIDNPFGYYEDIEILKIQREWFNNTLNHSIFGGWSDWGWTNSDSVSSIGKKSWESIARHYLSKRESNAKDGHWGWKEPRSTLILPFWKNIESSIFVIGCYRSPWDISDALNRIENSLFRENPEFILNLWLLYNQRLVEFEDRYPEFTTLIRAEAFLNSPNKLKNILKTRWNVETLSDLNQDDINLLISRERMPCIELPDPIETLYKIVYPIIFKVWINLNRRSDLTDISFNSSSSQLYQLKLNRIPSYKSNLTVVLVTYNPCHYLIESIASVERYANKQVELIIVDDGSYLADSLEIIKSLKDIGYNIVSQENKGLSAARNLGVSIARTEYIIPLDDDNRLLRPYLNQALMFMLARPNYDFAYGDRIDFGFRRGRFNPGYWHDQNIYHVNKIDACAIIKKSLWCKLGGFDEKMKALEDWDFWLGAYECGAKSAYINEPCFEYRVRENSMLRKHLNNHQEHRQTIDYISSKHANRVSSLLR